MTPQQYAAMYEAIIAIESGMPWPNARKQKLLAMLKESTTATADPLTVHALLEAKDAEIATLKSELARPESTEVSLMHAVIFALTTERDALRKDAGRYRWLAVQDLTHLSLGHIVDTKHDGEYCVETLDDTRYGKTLGAAIDAAMAKEPK